MQPLVLIRHGQSQWNLENRFTGWVDVPLSDQGKQEALQAAKLLQKAGLHFEQIYTSELKRAMETANIIIKNLKLEQVPVVHDWRLNERHYGDLQGKNKAEVAAQYGEEQVHVWRRSYKIPPPPAAKVDNTQGITGESLEMTYQRVFPYWNTVISQQVQQKPTLIVAHGNSLRALMKHLFDISDDVITGLELPTGVPIYCQLNDQLKGVEYRFMQ